MVYLWCMVYGVLYGWPPWLQQAGWHVALANAGASMATLSTPGGAACLVEQLPGPTEYIGWETQRPATAGPAAAAAAADPMMDSDENTRTCYRCGLGGHIRAQCTVEHVAADGKRVGRKAWKHFVRTRHLHESAATGDTPPQNATRRATRRGHAATRVWLSNCMPGSDPVAVAAARGTKLARRDLFSAARQHFRFSLDYVPTGTAIHNARTVR